MPKFFVIAVCFAMVFVGRATAENGLMDRVEHHIVDSDGVKIHYVTTGEGPLIVFVHGFPDFWYSWRNQMEGLSSDYTVAAMDTRGYNKSDKPEGVENYDMPLLIGDVAAVIRDQGQEKAIVVGHDWGGIIAWNFAMYRPEMTEKLIICNLPHPRGLARELANNPDQERNSAYARRFQEPDSHKALSAPMLAGMLSKGDQDLRAKYLEAFTNSSMESMMNYYKANFPKEPYEDNAAELPDIQCPVLQFHGLNDTALLPGGLNDTWNWIKKDFTLVTIPGIGHWVQHEAADLVTTTMKWWLLSRN